jgi:hypothetical protein
VTRVRDRIPSNDFQRLIESINSDSERELESAVLAIAKAVKRKPSTRRTAAIRTPR